MNSIRIVIMFVLGPLEALCEFSERCQSFLSVVEAYAMHTPIFPGIFPYWASPSMPQPHSFFIPSHAGFLQVRRLLERFAYSPAPDLHADNARGMTMLNYIKVICWSLRGAGQVKGGGRFPLLGEAQHGKLEWRGWEGRGGSLEACVCNEPSPVPSLSQHRCKVRRRQKEGQAKMYEGMQTTARVCL